MFIFAVIFEFEVPILKESVELPKNALFKKYSLKFLFSEYLPLKVKF